MGPPQRRSAFVVAPWPNASSTGVLETSLVGSGRQRGGINGYGLLYHLAKLGWTDIVLIEKNELTSGSTWLAAGNVVQCTPSRCHSRLNQYSLSLYRSVPAETGQDTGWRTTGSLRLATTTDRLDEYRHGLSRDHALGIACDLVSPREAQTLFLSVSNS